MQNKKNRERAISKKYIQFILPLPKKFISAQSGNAVSFDIKCSDLIMIRAGRITDLGFGCFIEEKIPQE